jgi:hypothetical protein
LVYQRHLLKSRAYTGSRKLMVDSHINCAVNGFDVARNLPEGFLEVLLPLHQEFVPRQQ